MLAAVAALLALMVSMVQPALARPGTDGQRSAGSRFSDAPGGDRPCILLELPGGGLKAICPLAGEGTR